MYTIKLTGRSREGDKTAPNIRNRTPKPTNKKIENYLITKKNKLSKAVSIELPDSDDPKPRLRAVSQEVISDNENKD
jgi:hypothetical protein